jgi:hypothetical protein
MANQVKILVVTKYRPRKWRVGKNPLGLRNASGCIKRVLTCLRQTTSDDSLTVSEGFCLEEMAGDLSGALIDRLGIKKPDRISHPCV